MVIFHSYVKLSEGKRYPQRSGKKSHGWSWCLPWFFSRSKWALRMPKNWSPTTWRTPRQRLWICRSSWRKLQTSAVLRRWNHDWWLWLPPGTEPPKKIETKQVIPISFSRILYTFHNFSIFLGVAVSTIHKWYCIYWHCMFPQKHHKLHIPCAKRRPDVNRGQLNTGWKLSESSDARGTKPFIPPLRVTSVISVISHFHYVYPLVN